jgi:hypothetical protein
MSDLERLTLIPEEKDLAMQALGGVAAGEISISNSKNALTRWRDRKRAASVRRSIFQNGAADETPYPVKDAEVDVINRSLEKVLEIRKTLPEESRNIGMEQSTEALLDKVKPFASQLHQR